MSRTANRRDFLKTTATIGASYWIAESAFAVAGESPLERIRFACIGVGGKGESDTDDAGRYGDVVAICDVDDERLAKAAEKYPKAEKFKDWRKLLDKMHNGIDAVTVSTPDHSHASAAATSMRLGKHAFVQKPLTHSIYEARVLADIAREQNIATQMGNQGTALPALRKAAAMIQAGVLGPVKEVYVWTNRPIWPQGGPRSAEKSPPSQLDWDLFVGPAPFRPYGDHYHPFDWRGWWDFGTGALGDMGCHLMNMPFMALDLRNPISVQAETTGHNRDSFPTKSRVTYQFAATDKRPLLVMHWLDGGHLPPQELLESFYSSGNTPPRDAKNHAEPLKYIDNGALIIGEKGMLYSPSSNGSEFQLSGVEEVPVSFREPINHFEEFVLAAKGGKPAVSNFPDYSVPLTETVLLGNLAIWAANEPDVPGKKIEWDAKSLAATNAPELAALIRREPRAGYSL